MLTLYEYNDIRYDVSRSTCDIDAITDDDTHYASYCRVAYFFMHDRSDST